MYNLNLNLKHHKWIGIRVYEGGGDRIDAVSTIRGVT